MRIDPNHCVDPVLLAAEVRRLRADVSRRRDLEAGLMAGLARLRLTDAEREAVEWAAYAAAQWYEHTASATLRGLLARMSGNGDCPAPDNTADRDNALRLLAKLDEALGVPRTPNPHATPGEGSVPPQRTEDGGK